MNETMRAQHFETITDGRARAIYAQICATCEMREGGMTDPDQHLVADIAMAEQIKQQLIEDIAKRGIGKEVRNGRQIYWADNKSVAQLRAYSDQQRKLLAELRLTPNSRKAAAMNIDDIFVDD